MVVATILVDFQGHASPGIYWLEGRLTEKHLENFRRELAEGGGLSSYPHPWLMPNFWEFPTVSMGLGPIMAIYQARFNKYLQDVASKIQVAKESGASLVTASVMSQRPSVRFHSHLVKGLIIWFSLSTAIFNALMVLFGAMERLFRN